MAKALPQKSVQSNKQLKSSLTVYEKLDDYQREAVDRAIERKTLAILFDQGTGKTWVSGGVIERLCHHSQRCFSVMLIVPLSNKTTTWKKFFQEHLPQVTVFEDLHQFVQHSGHKAILLHIDQFARESGKRLTTQLRKHRYSCIILDEAQRIKQRSSAWSRNIAKLRYCSTHKLILTGTPMDDQPIDMWAQFRFLRPNVFGTRWKNFERDFLEPLPDDDLKKLKSARPGSFKFKMLMRAIQIRRGKRKFDMAKLPQFLERVSPWCVRITQDDLGWDKAVFHRIGVDLEPRQRRVYDELEHNLVARLPKTTIATPLKVTRLEKLRQICGGYLLDEDKNVHVVGHAKLERLITLIHNSPLPVVVFCKYTAEVDAIVDHFERTSYVVAKFSGKVSRGDRDEIQLLFQKGRIDILVAQIKTGGVGIDLFRSHVAIMYSPVYSFIDFDQAIKRLKRRGQTRQVHIFLLFAKNTIDEDAFSAIVKKRSVTEQVLQGIKDRSERWQTRKRRMA